MKTIQLIIETISKMKEIGIPADMTIGTFKVKSNGSLINWAGWGGKYEGSVITFQIQIRPSHIQTLLNMGVKLNLESAVMAGLSEKALRFKKGREAIKQGDYAPYYYMGNPNNQQTGVIENWLNMEASCSPETLAKLDKYCRDNHRNQLAIHNNTILKNAGWKFKTKYSNVVEIESQYTNIKAIRRTGQGKPASQLLPIQKRVLKLN